MIMEDPAKAELNSGSIRVPEMAVQCESTILPHDVVKKLAELDLELSECDITQKGYEKKRRKLLIPYTIGTKESNNHHLDLMSSQHISFGNDQKLKDLIGEEGKNLSTAVVELFFSTKGPQSFWRWWQINGVACFVFNVTLKEYFIQVRLQ